MNILNIEASGIRDQASGIQSTNPDIIGAAICMQGQVALDGFGITRISNHIVASTEMLM